MTYPQGILGPLLFFAMASNNSIGPENIPPEPERSFGDYRAGRFMWVLRDVRRLAEPMAARGRQGMWSWDIQRETVLSTE